MSKTPPADAKTPEKNKVAVSFAIEILVQTAIVAVFKGLKAPGNRGKQHVSWQPSSAGRRKGTAQGPGGIQASDRREVRDGVLHHQPRWQGCRDLSSGRVAPYRGEADQAVQLQSFEKEISEQTELLRPDGGNGCAGAGAGPADPALIRPSGERSAPVREFYSSGSSQHDSR